MLQLESRLILVAALALTILSACSPTGSASSTPSPKRVLVAAAASLTDAFPEIKTEFEKDNKGVAVTYTFGSSGVLQQQIEQGAPVDVFASAAEQQMDSLDQKNLLAPASRRDFAGNTAVLVVPKERGAAITGFSDLTKPEIKHIAIGNPDTVPAGAYAKQILQSLGLWDGVQSRLVYGETVRQVLSYVEGGNAEAGIVYSTDAITSDKVKVAAKAPEGSSQPIVYPIAVVSGTKSPNEAKAFVDFVVGPKGQAILVKYGFLTAPSGGH